MAKKKHERHSLNLAKLPPKLKEQIEEALPPPVVQALFAGCHEMDFLLSAELLLELTRVQLGPLGIEENLVATWHRVREARLHLSAFNQTMREAEAMQHNGGGLVVASEADAKRAGIDIKA